MKKILILLFCLGTYLSGLYGQHVANNIHDTVIPDSGIALPEVLLTDLNGAEIRLADVIGKQKTILVIYRGGWCPYCTAQLTGLAQNASKIRKMGFNIVGIAGEDIQHMQDFIEQKDIPYRIYHDKNIQLASSLGIAYKVDKKTLSEYKNFGVHIDEGVLALPTVIITGANHKINYIFASKDYTQRISSEELMREVQSLATFQSANE